MDLLDCKTDIHLGVATNLGTFGIQCTAYHLYIYQYGREEMTGQLEKVSWDNVTEIRLNAQTGEVKFTLSSKCEFMPKNEPLKIWLQDVQALFQQINQQFASCFVVAHKWKPNLAGHQYFKPSCKRVRDQIPEAGPISEADFEEHMEIVEIAQELQVFEIPQQAKCTIS